VVLSGDWFLAKRFFKAVLAAALLAIVVWAACVVYFVRRGPVLLKSIEFYDVDALTREGLRQQISQRGPKGYDGLTDWGVSVDWLCRVELRSTITLPKHTRLADLGSLQRGSWKAYLAALRRHEFTHQYHGEMAAKEVVQNACLGAKYIIRYWIAQTEIFDLRTGHGAKDGVQLKLWTP
jgi:predicted secreted Zn-dependent protease